MNTFQELPLSQPLQRAIAEMGYTQPSPIQAEALPILLGEATDFLGLAATGTGKTAAFGLPAIEKIDPDLKKVQVLVMSPTRELALQVAGQIDLLGKYKGVRSVAIYGGASYGIQIAGLKSGAQVVVGTPGRIIDHLERGTLRLENVQIVVLDEADEMISMGFKEAIEQILESVSREKSRIWLFSATMAGDVRKVADRFLDNPKKVQVNRTEMLSSTVQQIYYMVHERDKPEVLCKLIDAADGFYGVIFCQTKALVSDLTDYLTRMGYKADCLHGDKSQDARERTMRAFRERQVNIMVCTDVAARGLDVKDVTHVINYSLPRELDNYVHRIGRTARSGKEGMALSLVTNSHRGLIGQIERLTKSKMVEGKIPSRRDVAAKKVANLFTQLQSVENFTKYQELISPEQRELFASMPQEELTARFLALLMPGMFTGIGEEGLRDSRAPGQGRDGAASAQDGGKLARHAEKEEAGRRPRHKRFERSAPQDRERRFGGGERRFAGGGERRFAGGERKFSGGSDRKFSGGGERRPFKKDFEKKEGFKGPRKEFSEPRAEGGDFAPKFGGGEGRPKRDKGQFGAGGGFKGKNKDFGGKKDRFRPYRKDRPAGDGQLH